MLYVIGQPVLLPYLNSLSVRFFAGIMGCVKKKRTKRSARMAESINHLV